MVGRGQPVRLGPFVGGINTASDTSFVSDTEAVDVVNFNLDIDGSLIARPPIKETTNNSGTWTERIVMIGRATLAGVDYVIGSNTDGTYAFTGSAWSTAQTGLTSKVALQYKDNLWIIPAPGETADGGRWDGTTFTADTDMPTGESAIFFKDRLFVVPGKAATSDTSRIYFTEPITSTTLTWTLVTNFIDISPGDGENLMDILIYDDQLMLFKEDSTYVLSFEDDPLTGAVRQISDTIGATYKRSVAQFENSIFVYHEGTVFEIVNYSFQPINVKTPFYYDSTAPSTRAESVFLSVLGRNLIVRYYNRIYVYGLWTKVWTRWESASSDLHNFGPLVPMPTTSNLVKYYAGSSLSSAEKVFYIQDGYDATVTETTLTPTSYDITCSLTTKTYDFDDQLHYKKLYWWAMDCLATGAATGEVQPVTTSYLVTWNSLASYTWNQIGTLLGTWNSVLDSIPSTTTSVTSTSVPQRQLIRFNKSLRFRQANFTVTMVYNGTTVTGPCRLFTLSAIVGLKQTVSKQVT